MSPPRRPRASPMRRRLMRRKPIRRVRRGGIRQPAHYFKRSVYIPGWFTANNLGDQTTVLTSTLADVPQFGEFTALYDQYCLKGIKLEIIPRFNVSSITNDGAPSELMTVLDYDGSYPSTLAGFMQYQNLKVSRGTAIHKRFWKPAVLQATYDSVTSTGYGVKKNVWIDSADTTVKHYGLAVIAPQLGGTIESCKYDLRATYYIACKNVR